MTPAETIDLINLVILAGFTLGLVVSVASTAFRMLALHRGGERLPYLIWRDLTCYGLLALVFVLIALARVFDWTVRDQIWWSLLTGFLAVSSVWVYVYYELFIVGHRRDRR